MDASMLTQSINQYLMQTISVYDTAGEAFYQGLLLGLCAILNGRYRVLSNRESGLGRFDICLIPLLSGLPGFVFELKATKNAEEKLDALAAKALLQIDMKQYDAALCSSGITEIIKIGIAFRGKQAVSRSSMAAASGK